MYACGVPSQLLTPGRRQTPRHAARREGGRYAFMSRILATDLGAALYAKAKS